MKYAIYDKAADAYFATMEFDTVAPDDYTRYAFGYNEYITKARLLDTKEEAADVVTRTEGLKFMDKGRFVIHSFDDTSIDQYIISEAGNPTKVVNNITVDLEGTINVKYGTMLAHWSTTSLKHIIDRMNTLQKAVSDIYTPWNSTFDIYKVITIIDERSCPHYQFINVTAKGLEKYSKNEEESSLNKRITSNWKYLYEESDKDRVTLNKRIEELEKANYELGERVAERGSIANRLLDENNSLKAKVEVIKKEARDWKKLYENADSDRSELKNVIDIIHTDLTSATACDDLKDTLNALTHNSGLDRISMPTKVGYILDNGTYLTAKDEIYSIINHIITILESHEHNKKTVYAAEEIPKAIANNIVDICEANDEFEVTLKKFLELYEAVNALFNTDDDPIIHAFKGVLEIFTALEGEVRNIIDKKKGTA